MVASFDSLDAFHKISGLKVNNEKAEVLWIGASCSSQKEFLPERNLKWAKDSVKALGVWFSTIMTKALSLNYNDKIEKIQSIKESWATRRFLGKLQSQKPFLHLSWCTSWRHSRHTTAPLKKLTNFSLNSCGMVKVTKSNVLSRLAIFRKEAVKC